MDFSELNYPESLIPVTQLLASARAGGYDCHLYRDVNTPHFVLRINGRDFVVRITSMFEDIIKIKGIEPNENYFSNDAQKRSEDSKKDD